MTISDLAEAKGLGRSAVSERVLRLEKQGLITTRPGKGKQKLVNLAEFDRVIGQVADLGREQGAATKRGAGDDDGGGASSAYTREQARRMAYLAEMARLDLDERKGELVKVSELRPVITAAGEATAKAIDSLLFDEDEIRRAAQGEDEMALRSTLKAIARRIRTEALQNLRADLATRRGASEQVATSSDKSDPYL